MKYILWVTRALSVAVGVYVGYLLYTQGKTELEFIGWGLGAAAVAMVVTEVLLRLLSDARWVLDVASMCGGAYVGYLLHTKGYVMLDCIVFGMCAGGAGILLVSVFFSFLDGFKWVRDIDRALQPKAWLMLLGSEVVGVAAAAFGGYGLMKLLQNWIEAESSYGELLFMAVPWNPWLQGAIVGAIISCVAWQKFAPACMKGLRWIWLMILVAVTGAVAGTAYCVVGGVLVALVLAVLFIGRWIMNFFWSLANTSYASGSSGAESSRSSDGWEYKPEDFGVDTRQSASASGYHSSKIREMVRLERAIGNQEDEIDKKVARYMHENNLQR